jgi:hypothetical protein
MLRSRGGHLQHASAPQDRYSFRTTSRLFPIGRAEDYRERETSEIRRRSGGSGPPLRTALQNSKLPGTAHREAVAVIHANSGLSSGHISLFSVAPDIS